MEDGDGQDDAATKALASLLRVLRALRQGFDYGTTLRFPHALVMTTMFSSHHSLASRLSSIWRLTFEHGRNLALFAGLYKGIMEAARHSGVPKTLGPLLAGGVAGRMVWARYSKVNYQIVLYLFSRVLVGAAIRASSILHKSTAAAVGDTTTAAAVGAAGGASGGVGGGGAGGGGGGGGGGGDGGRIHGRGGLLAQLSALAGSLHFQRVYPVFATVVWAVVMWLYEHDIGVLHPSLAASMRVIYGHSNSWTGVGDFLPSTKSGAILGLYGMYLCVTEAIRRREEGDDGGREGEEG